MENEIIDVKKITKDGSDWWAPCPHCKVVLCLGSVDPRGEQFHHKKIITPGGKAYGCDGWMAVTSDARLVI